MHCKKEMVESSLLLSGFMWGQGQNSLFYFKLSYAHHSFLPLLTWLQKPWNVGARSDSHASWWVCHRDENGLQLLHNLCCAPSCSRTARFHVSDMSQSMVSVAAHWQAHNVWHHPPTPLSWAAATSQGQQRPELVARKAGQAFCGFFQCCDVQLLWRSTTSECQMSLMFLLWLRTWYSA